MPDELSKETDFGDYRLDGGSFQYIQDRFDRFNVDYFASEWSHHISCFYSRYWSPSCSGVDAFAQFWGFGFGFFHPPTKLIPRVVRKLIDDRAHRVLVVPRWEGAYWWNCIVEAVYKGKLKFAFEVWPIFEAPEWMTQTKFLGRSQFAMCVFVSRV